MEVARGTVTYISRHKHSETVGTAFAKGLGMEPVRNARTLLPGDAAFYGFLRGLEPLLRQAQRENRNWWYLDNGYFRPGHYDGHYRVTKNAYQHNGFGTSDGSRFNRLGIEIAPWKTGRHVLVCPPGPVMAVHLGFRASDWYAETMETLSRSTDRPIRVRHKLSETPLADDLTGAHCLVTAYSNAAVEALIAGVPVFCTHPCAAQVMGRPNVAEVETPLYPEDRERWAGVLADNQFTLEEMRAGMCNEIMESNSW